MSNIQKKYKIKKPRGMRKHKKGDNKQNDNKQNDNKQSIDTQHQDIKKNKCTTCDCEKESRQDSIVVDIDVAVAVDMHTATIINTPVAILKQQEYVKQQEYDDEKKKAELLKAEILKINKLRETALRNSALDWDIKNNKQDLTTESLLQQTGPYIYSDERRFKGEDKHTTMKNEHASLIAVFDGHGGKGGVLSAELAKHRTEIFFKETDFTKLTPFRLKSMMPDLFKSIHDDIKKLHDDDSSIQSGTTVSIVFQGFCPINLRRYILTAHVGDSDAMLIYPDQIKEKLIKLTAGDHGICSLVEQERIESEYRSGKIKGRGTFMYNTPEGKRNVFIRKEDGSFELETGFQSIFSTYNGDRGGYYMYRGNSFKNSFSLNMTRSCGDIICHDYGVTYIPTVSIVFLSEEENPIVLVASDGHWDTSLYDQVAIDLKNTSNIQELMERSLERSKALMPGYSSRDDMTIIVARYPSHKECVEVFNSMNVKEENDNIEKIKSLSSLVVETPIIPVVLDTIIVYEN